ncbi:MAG TPA: hypothetical protein VNQ80_17460 [Parapedobacter sp.]|uniref:hypothetical protein n=1 Tax=Parapedobacter sp. TaxID=1958893 RepID=UPI002B8F519D|nr:hypothetical protein [Parapedobacter sp.]HWK59136.1 hypothetical protein [Parapedobacter sp.]
MESKETIVQQLEKAIELTEKEIATQRSYIALREANDLYNKLLEDGVAKRRGFTLRGIEDSHLFHTKLNSHI